MSFIRRERYLDRITPYMGKDLIKVIIGQRRVGKSVILRQLIDDASVKYPKKKSIYLNKEHKEWAHIQTREALYDEIAGYDIIAIDEIQEIPERERALRDLQSKGKKDIYISGSNAQLLAGELATMLGGRYVSFTIYPLVFTEFCTFHQLQPTIDTFKKYMQFGGMPYLKHLGLDWEIVKIYLQDIWDTIVLRDIIKRFGIKNVGLFEMILSYLSHNIGAIFSAKKIADYHIAQGVKLSPSTIIEYLGYAQASMVVSSAKRYAIKSKKLFQYKEKRYFTDIGIRNAVVGGMGDFLGGVLEQIVYMHLLASGWTVRVGEMGDQEIDFVCERDDQRMYVQVAYLLASQETIEREYRGLVRIQDSRPKYVVSLDDITLSPREGVMHKNVVEWIQEL